ncbi:thymidine phosphorylase [uncultured Pseudodesulfovibrio sp.]|uniref:thymidine phosphorylase n=1 Tax=uncultured Pseudodesulfovibrio sp. TaxID=2035858 RepID=UPI0029C912D9|nr:thymidine phosphorylase [uncultured Pseudodesulfovibrio sp.]
MLPQEIIRNKRDGHILSEQEICFFVEGMTDGSISEGQVAAFGMAVFFNGMNSDESAALTRAMTRSGDVLSWNLDGPVLDKHSTGGVGDLVSLVLGPMIAACGGYVPMISGRGLGHTGGTLDKLESIPGYNAFPDNAIFQRTVRDAGVAIIGQTGNLAPADGRFYAVRDVTATVESIPLITASILSKKLAAGLDGLVMDVKTGSGAFMASREQSKALAQSLVSVGNRAGVRTSAVVTSMDEPLASCAGNAIEVREAMRYLTGEHRDSRLHAVVMALCVEMLMQGGLAHDEKAAEGRLSEVLESGKAAERFGRMTALLGGPADFVQRYDEYLPKAPSCQEVLSPKSGYVSAWDTRRLGLAVVGMGGGRTRADQSIDPTVGLTHIARVGQRVEQGDLLAVLHCADEAATRQAREMVLDAVSIAPSAPDVGVAVCFRVNDGS